MVERVGARVEVAAIKRGPLNAALLMQSTQGIVDLGVDRVGEVAGVESLRGPLDNSFHGGEQSAIAGKPNRFIGPEPGIVKAWDVSERVVGAAMRVAGQITESF